MKQHVDVFNSVSSRNSSTMNAYEIFQSVDVGSAWRSIESIVIDFMTKFPKSAIWNVSISTVIILMIYVHFLCHLPNLMTTDITSWLDRSSNVCLHVWTQQTRKSQRKRKGNFIYFSLAFYLLGIQWKSWSSSHHVNHDFKCLACLYNFNFCTKGFFFFFKIISYQSSETHL